MNKANAILRSPLFTTEFEELSKLEKDRGFCRHDMVHLLDVARIAYILYLEAGTTSTRDIESIVTKELIYATAYLHDIGRARQYIDGTPHEQAGARIALPILQECGFSQSETNIIIDAILSHRTRGSKKPGFAGLMYRADKLSRSCFDCKAIEQCDWEIKNTQVEY